MSTPAIKPTTTIAEYSQPTKLLEDQELTKFLGETVYECDIKVKYQMKTVRILASDIKSARQRMDAYCEAWGLRLINVRPFFTDLDKRPDLEP